jgi:predicted nucleotidyltransferase
MRGMERRLPAFILDRQGALAALCRRTQARRLAVFGSAVRDDFEPSRSDVDFLVAFEDLPPIAYSNAYFELKQGLEDLFARPVDLLTPAMLKNPHLRARVEAEQLAVYGG